MNQTVLEYFRKNASAYPVEALKEKVLAAGYLPADVEAAAALVAAPKEEKPVASPVKVSKPASSKRFGWMKLAGILGMFFFVLYLALITAGVYFEVNLPAYFGWLLVSLIAIVSCVYLYGFVVLGAHTKSRLLRISSYTRIGLALVFIGLYLMLRPVFLSAGFRPSGVVIGLCFVYVLFFIAAKYVFATSLVRVGDSLKFLKVVGILTFIYISLITLGFLYVVYLFFSAGNFNLDPSAMNLLYWDFVVIEIFNISSLFFESVALFFAHRKFE